MFGLSSIELLFVGIVALVLIGPKDLPQFVRGLGAVFGRARRFFEELKGNFSQLEREVSLAEDSGAGRPAWLEFLPDEVRELRESIQPHGDREETARKYREVKAAVARARQQYADSVAAEAPDSAAGES